MSQEPVQKTSRICISDQVIKSLLKGYPIELGGTEYVFFDKLYIRARVNDSEEAKPLASPGGIEALALAAEMTMTEAQAFLLGTEHTLTEHNRRNRDSNPINLIEAQGIIGRSLQKHLNKTITVHEIEIDGETVKLDQPAQARIDSRPGTSPQVLCSSSLFTMGEAIDYVGSQWRIFFENNELNTKYPGAMIQGTAVKIREGYILPPKCDLSEPGQHKKPIFDQELGF